jgi:hypothetical protein
MKKIFIFLFLLGVNAISAMQMPQLPASTPTNLLHAAILKPDYDQVKHILYSNDFTQAEIQTALETTQGAQQLMILTNETANQNQLNQISNLLKAFRVYSARSAKK